MEQSIWYLENQVVTYRVYKSVPIPDRVEMVLKHLITLVTPLF